MENGKPSIRPKGKGKGIMVSDFITAEGRIMVPLSISDMNLEEKELPSWFASCYLESGKDNCWNSDKMGDHTIKIAIPIFREAFPGCIAVFAFDNASNHARFASDALRVDKLNEGPGGAQHSLREGFIHHKGLPLVMQFPSTYHNFLLAGKQKRMKQILVERGLGNQEYYGDCTTSNGHSGCSPEGCSCAGKILAAERDFQEQKGRLQEEVEARGFKVLLYPKFHGELNPIEQYWCQAKSYTREHCDYTLEGLRKTVPLAFAAVEQKSIWGFFNCSERTIGAYRDGLMYGCKEFKYRVYEAHRRIEDKTKW
jgi:hypothetical protein